MSAPGQADGVRTAPGNPTFDAYDVSPDGQRFLLAGPYRGAGGAAEESFIVVLNYLEELRRVVPVD